MAKIIKIFVYPGLFLVFLLQGFYTHSQTVGLVLSGGGSKGLAHIGVIKALEEHQIPIDYITGTSAGALVGALYAAGYSPQEIEAIVLSERFQMMTEGKLEEGYVYYFKKAEDNPAWISYRFSLDSLKQSAIPTNLITPSMLDWEMMTTFAKAEAAAQYDFDKLLVPFRCVASDISEKKSVVFREGHLNEAVRASMSYPFYVKPIKVNGKLLYDGGLYNNFSANIMMDDFLPDVVIGSNVTSNAPPPDDDNLLSQLENMIVTRQDFEIKCDQSYIIEPDITGISSFDFRKIKSSIDAGYAATIQMIDSIRQTVKRVVTPEELYQKRAAFKAKQMPLEFSHITVNGLKPKQEKYVLNTLFKKKRTISVEELKPKYFRVYGDDKIKFMYPKSYYDSISKTYKLNIQIKKEKDFSILFGGNFSSKPINTGYLGLKYHYLRRASWTFGASSSFGRFYSAARASIKCEPAAKLHYLIEPEFVIQRWDYFRSSNFFFEDTKPSYLVQDEQYGALNFAMAVSNKGKLGMDVKYADINDRYYQTENFTSKDTADRTNTLAFTTGIAYERSSLNEKQYANEGSFIRISARYVNAEETTIPGSTSLIKDTASRFHNWPVFKFQYQQYLLGRQRIKIGFSTENVFSFQGFYKNYTASVLAAPAFQPIPESKTLFFDDFRAHKYVSFGMQLIYSVLKNVDLRAEGYIFQPFNSIIKDEIGNPAYSTFLLKRHFIASSSAVYHSPLGPVSFSVNYYSDQKQPFTFLLNFGYIIFNKRAINN